MGVITVVLAVVGIIIVLLLIIGMFRRQKPVDAFNSACDLMTMTEKKLLTAFIIWSNVKSACGSSPSTTETKEMAGIAHFWLSLIHLLCAEKAKMLYHVIGVTPVGSKLPAQAKPCWPDSAQDAINNARIAIPYLGTA